MNIETAPLDKTDEECLGVIICDHPTCKVAAEWRMNDPQFPYNPRYACDSHKLWCEREF